MPFLMTTTHLKKRRSFLIFTILLFAIVAGRSSAQDESIPNYVASVAWSPDGARVAVSHGPLGVCNLDDREYVVDIISVATEEIIDQILIEARCVAPSISWNQDGSRLLVTGSSGEISTVWNMVASPRLVTQSELPASREFSVDAWSPDGTRIAHVTEDADARIWDARRGSTLNSCCNDDALGSLVSIDWSPGTANLVTGYNDGGVAIWDSREFGQLMKLEALSTTVSAVGFSDDGRQIAAADQNGLMRVWDGLTGELLYELQEEGHFDIATIAWNPNGGLIATAGKDGSVHVWDTDFGELIGVIENSGPVYSVDWSPDGTRLVYGGESADNQGILEFALAPIPRRCDITVEAAEGAASLVNAVTAANEAPTTLVICLTEDTYTFDPASVTELFTEDGLNALPSIAATVIINGRGAVLERNGESEFDFRFFHISGNGALILNEVTLSGGLVSGEDGGAIINKGMLTLIKTALIDNHTTEAGGALRTSGLIVNIVDSDFSSNSARDDGGAVENSSSTIEISATTFFNNTSSDDGGAFDNGSGITKIENSLFSLNNSGDDGGAIYNGAGMMQIAGTIFRSNSSGDDGGGLLGNDTSVTFINSSTFALNRAAEDGGAIDSSGRLVVNNSCFVNNSAPDGSEVTGNPETTNVANNWWGSAGGPIIGDALERDIPFEPILSARPASCPES